MNSDDEKLVQTEEQQDAGCITSAMLFFALVVLVLAMCSCCTRMTPGGPESAVLRKGNSHV